MADSKLVQLIMTVSQRGRGSVDDPLRDVVSYHLPDGTLVVEHDPAAADPAELVREALAEALVLLEQIALAGALGQDRAEHVRSRVKLLRRLTKAPTDG